MNPTKQGQVVSLQIGMPVTYEYEGKEWRSGIYKQPVGAPVLLTRTGFDGDGQADMENHGGPDKAVCVYCAGHYPYWSRLLELELPPAAFGENITVSELDEKEVSIGDIYRMGEALVQVSQPRQPCYKLGYKYNRPDMPLLVQNNGFTGYYFRVLEEGFVKPGDAIVPVERSPHGMRVEEANRIMYRQRTDIGSIRSLLEVPELSESWRKQLTKRLNALL